MKHKIVKTAAVAAAVMIAAGGICLGAGLALGGSPNFFYDKSGIHMRENTSFAENPDYVLEYTEISAVRNLDISLAEADLEVVSGKEWAVEYRLSGFRTAPEYSMDGQTLKIREGRDCLESERQVFGFGYHWWYDEARKDRQAPYVKITVPDTGKLEQVVVSSEYGNVSIEKNLKAENVCVNVETGEVKLDGWDGDSISFDMEYGSLVTGNLTGKNVDVRNQDGTVKTGALKVETAYFYLEYGDLSATVEKASSLEVESENGVVSLGLVGGMDQYGVSLHTEWGTIRTPHGIVEADEYEGNSDFVRMEGDTAGIRVYSEYGDIRIRDAA